MAQLNWTYVADSGQQYRVVLYHGGRSGHVLVTVNQKVSIVDFYVRDTKTYQILLEDELFLLELVKEPNGFEYAFVIDKVADTDRNKARRIQKKRQTVWVVIGALAFFAIAGSLAMLLMNWQESVSIRKNVHLLEELGDVAYGRLGKDDNGIWHLYFTEGPMIYELELDARSVRAAGLQIGDDQGVLFLKGNPKVCRVAWEYFGPDRARRLFEKWIGSWEVDPVLKSCVYRFVIGHREWLTHPEAPWLHSQSGGWSTWLGNQNISFRALLRTECGSDGMIEE